MLTEGLLKKFDEVNDQAVWKLPHEVVRKSMPIDYSISPEAGEFGEIVYLDSGSKSIKVQAIQFCKTSAGSLRYKFSPGSLTQTGNCGSPLFYKNRVVGRHEWLCTDNSAVNGFGRRFVPVQGN